MSAADKTLPERAREHADYLDTFRPAGTITVRLLREAALENERLEREREAWEAHGQEETFARERSECALEAAEAERDKALANNTALLPDFDEIGPVLAQVLDELRDALVAAEARVAAVERERDEWRATFAERDPDAAIQRVVETIADKGAAEVRCHVLEETLGKIKRAATAPQFEHDRTAAGHTLFVIGGWADAALASSAREELP